MLRTGMRVQKMTKKVGQAAPVGTIASVHGDSIEVKWDDGHTTIVSRISVTPAKNTSRS